MIKYKKSSIHDQNIITFFKGLDFAIDGEYFYKESQVLFGKENLGVNLVEHDADYFSPIDIKNNAQISHLVKNAVSRMDGLTTIVDLSVSAALKNYDALIEYTDESSDNLRAEILLRELKERGGFLVDLEKVQQIERPVLLNLDVEGLSSIRIILSADFISHRSSSLSEKNSHWLDRNRYVDTQAFYFFTMTCLAGTGTADI